MGIVVQLFDGCCPACGEKGCVGHRFLNEPALAAILKMHQDGDHERCDPAGCDDAREVLRREHAMALHPAGKARRPAARRRAKPR